MRPDRSSATCQVFAIMNVVLISTYELGHQPFGLASPAAWLKAAGAAVTCLDLAVQQLAEADLASADLIALYLPMHTATRLAAQLIPRIKTINAHAHICCYGLYAPMNEAYLRGLGVESIIGGEFEEGLVALYQRLSVIASDAAASRTQRERNETESKHHEAISMALLAIPQERFAMLSQPEPIISLARQEFILPDRRTLPHLSKYAYLMWPDGCRKVVGYTEASRGCKHTCRHCPIVPVYNGQLRIVQSEVVIEDIEQQVNSGAGHITFGDPDFFNGPGHTIPIVEKLHQLWPQLTYDVTIKVEHLLKHARWLPVLRDTGCLFVTSAVEAVDDRILDIFDKRHTRSDFIEVVSMFNEIGLTLNPTFVTFTPWTSLEGYRDLLDCIAQLDLIENVAPIQYAIRLLIPAGSKLLDVPQVQHLIGPFDQAALCYPWTHPDARVDQLYEEVLGIVTNGQAQHQSRLEIFDRVWQAAGGDQIVRIETHHPPSPHLSENWYC
jgi:radical SAM superfamily enzyme YgiQ (UPF0313 family)